MGAYGRRWDTADRVLVLDSEFGVAGTRQFEFEAPDGLLVRSIDLQSEVADIAQHPHDTQIPIEKRRDYYESYLDDFDGRRSQMLRDLDALKASGGGIIRMGQSQGARRILRLATRSFYEDEKRRLYIVNLVVERGFLAWAAAAGASVAFAVLAGLLVASSWSLTLHTNVAPDFASSFALALPLASVALTWLGYGQEHPRASRLFAPFRRVLFSSAIILLAAALALTTVRLDTTVGLDSVASLVGETAALLSGSAQMALAVVVGLGDQGQSAMDLIAGAGAQVETWCGGRFVEASVLWCLLFSLATFQGYLASRGWGLLSTTLERNREAT